MARNRDLPALVLAAVAAATGAALVAGGATGELLLAVGGLALPALLLAAGGPARPRWLGWIYLALAADLIGTALALLALRADGATPASRLPLALGVQLVGLWLVPFALTATAALVAGRRR